jgi:phage shock protein PspC (stress-responsive transcriptional regulator)
MTPAKKALAWTAYQLGIDSVRSIFVIALGAGGFYALALYLILISSTARRTS